MTTQTPQTDRPVRNPEAGFTLAEALIATLILMFGLASIFNLMIVATTSNSVASRSSAATMVAAQQLEVLRSTPFSALVAGPVDTLETQTPGYFRMTTVEGVGTFETRWLIQTLTNANTLFLQVRTEPGGFRARSARAEFTTIRTCVGGVAAGCPL
ncbi:MAG: prepilin-type N-terminal cleavage/methylation domain-containing protein [Vicinamibacteria bacterium]|nr:prepilin-type N-terminal cleavage/methylation domain-containing protein [Vicinamibacteria bacterium]